MQRGCAVEANQTSPPWDDFSTVGIGWDPAQVRAVIVDLTQQIAGLELEVEAAEAREAARASETASRVAGEVFAEAEVSAGEIRDRALAAAKRLRSRASEEGREIRLQARRDSLQLVKKARLDADRVVGIAREQEAMLWERVQSLQSVVRRTEALLREVAVRDYAGEDSESEHDGEIATLPLDAGSGVEAPPESVARLLAALRTGEAPDS